MERAAVLFALLQPYVQCVDVLILQPGAESAHALDSRGYAVGVVPGGGPHEELHVGLLRSGGGSLLRAGELYAAVGARKLLRPVELLFKARGEFLRALHAGQRRVLIRLIADRPEIPRIGHPVQHLLYSGANPREVTLQHGLVVSFLAELPHRADCANAVHEIYSGTRRGNLHPGVQGIPLIPGLR